MCALTEIKEETKKRKFPFTPSVPHVPYNQRIDVSFLLDSPSSTSYMTFDTCTEKMWKCPCCQRSYVRKGDLKFHFTQKHPEHGLLYPDIVNTRSTKTNKPWKCPIPSCSSGYMRKCDLKNHFIMKHPQDMDKYPELTPNEILLCPFSGCNQSFARRCNLLEHCRYQHHHHSEEKEDGVVQTKWRRKTDVSFLLNSD